MSSSVGVCRPFSSFETLEAGQDSDAASRAPVSPACRRSSRRRSPRARRASWTLVTLLVVFGGKVIPADGPVPGRIPPVIVLHARRRVFDDLHATETVVVLVG